MSASESTTEGTEPRRIAGRYRLTEPLGAGAMGTVWSGYDEVLHRAVAVKELKVPPGVPRGEIASMRERMMREARTLGGLSHPNVITLFDVVDVSGDPFVVMELLPSRNLSEVIGDQGRLTISQAASVGLATAAALQAAHRAGITHRDVKPGNVLVAHDGRIKLTDFGIARKSNDVTMTQTGLVLGSPAYISPEVAAGQPVTPAADLWGLGATLFAALEARPPYDVDGDPVKTVTAVVHGEVPKVHVGGSLAEVIAALMVKDPDQRMSLADVRHYLRPLLADPDDPLFPGSVDAYTTATPPLRPISGRSTANGSGAGPAVTPPPAAAPPGPAGTGASPHADASGQWGAHPTGTPAPLADDPGPLPGAPRPHPTPAPTPSPAPPPAPRPRPADPVSGTYGTTGAPGATGAPGTTGGYGAAGTYGAGPGTAGTYGAAGTYGGPAGAAAAGGTQGTGRRPSWQAAPPQRPPMSRAAPPPPPATASLSGKWAVPLALAGAVAVLAGAALGWSSTRVLVGQPVLTTTVSSPAGNGANPQLTTHADTGRYGTGAQNFTAAVPAGWEEYRVPVEGEALSVRFISPDGSREISFEKLAGTRTNPAKPADFLGTLTTAKLGVASVTKLEESGNRVRYRTDLTGPGGQSSRMTYAQVNQAGNDVWVIRLTVPADRAGANPLTLFNTITQKFQS
ncbi:hypothetical protein GCM10023321_15630 [Pseudonocardia eucalypti]|uniref:non-specific serine/threonine protein kinase n=1 Tax=Pseudonocardia eucalypti TaxID=648755 RepID=A0ABP9PQP9_9PSEU|nr:serine/threonine protein kinase [Pseudonocardia eucalypti]